MKNKSRNNKNLILVMLAFFCVAVGLWGNYRQLWLASNNLSAASISRVISIASVVAALSLLYYTKKFSINKLKMGMLITIFLKLFINILLLLIDGSDNLFLIKFLSFFDIACENIILSSIYPFIMCYQKSDEMYGKKSVVENFGKTFGVLIGSIFFGKIIFNYVVNYQTCLIISIFFILLSLFTLFLINDKDKPKIEESKNNIFKYLFKNKILIFFLIYNTVTNMSFSIAVGLKMLMLTTFNNLSTNRATYFVLAFLILDIIIGAITINKLKCKNDYINISIKFLIRIILNILVFITNNSTLLLIALGYSLITNVAYSYIISGFMTNTVKEKYILDFTVINYITNLLGEALGVLIAGALFSYGFRYISLMAAIAMTVQLIMAYYIVHIKRIRQSI